MTDGICSVFSVVFFFFFMDYNNKQQIKWLMCFSVMIVWCLLLMCKWDMGLGADSRVESCVSTDFSVVRKNIKSM